MRHSPAVSTGRQIRHSYTGLKLGSRDMQHPCKPFIIIYPIGTGSKTRALFFYDRMIEGTRAADEQT